MLRPGQALPLLGKYAQLCSGWLNLNISQNISHWHSSWSLGTLGTGHLGIWAWQSWGNFSGDTVSTSTL